MSQPGKNGIFVPGIDFFGIMVNRLDVGLLSRPRTAKLLVLTRHLLRPVRICSIHLLQVSSWLTVVML